ncbi:MAG TPA: permease-like cell division protein FtsX [Micromonosporaceae bacterium]|nr:permease-like cell division protein FtsX [Micromonosporaceae bacterium]
MRAKYVLSEVMVGLWRNVTMTVAMIITMAVSLTMLGASVVMYHQVGLMKKAFLSNVQVSIFLKTTVTPDQTQLLSTKIKGDSRIASVTFLDETASYNQFKLQMSGDPQLLQSITPDQVPQSFRIKLKDPSEVPQIKAGYNGLPGVDQVIDQGSVLKRVFAVLGALQGLALTLAIAQGIAALLLVANTIQVAAYSKRREVAVMKLVGASNWFIQSPFVLEAMFAGVIGALIAYGGLVSAKFFLIDGSLKALQSLLGPVHWSTINLMLPLLLVVAALVSGVTGWFTLRFYIKK